MRNVIDYMEVRENNHFWLYFLMNNFPESLDDQTDQTISEIISDHYEIDKEWVDHFTGYDDGVFDENDGYVENPTTLKIPLSTANNLFIEFHPGDTIYFIDHHEIGRTGPHYSIQKINWEAFCHYTQDLDNREKLLLMPMVTVKITEKELLEKLIYDCLNMVQIEREFAKISDAIIENCLSV